MVDYSSVFEVPPMSRGGFTQDCTVFKELTEC